jgi:hypothetical protein
MKNPVLITALFASLLAGCASFSSLSSNSDASIETTAHAVAISQVFDYLHTHSLYPILDEDEDLLISTKIDYVLHRGSELPFVKAGWRQNKKDYVSIFGLIKYPSGQSRLRLLYFSSDSNSLPSPELYIDVLQSAYLVFPRLEKLNYAHVFIEPEETLDGASVQTWTAFNTREKIEFSVILRPDGQGGTYFTIAKENQ